MVFSVCGFFSMLLVMLLVNDRTVNDQVAAEATRFGCVACLPRQYVFEGDEQTRDGRCATHESYSSGTARALVAPPVPK